MPVDEAASILRRVNRILDAIRVIGDRRLQSGFLAIILLGATGCASTPSSGAGGQPPSPPPAPVTEDETVRSDSEDREAALRDAEDLRAMAAQVRAAQRDRPPTIYPFGVTWAPIPVEGSAFGIRVLERTGGRVPVSIRGEFAELPVRFGRLEGQWFGLAAIPIGSEREQELRLEFAFEDGSTHAQSLPLSVEPREFASTELSVAPRFTSPSEEALARIGRERELIRSVLDTASAVWLIEGPFIEPRPMSITSPYGQARVFNGELRSRHTGLDLRGADGDPVYAAARGRVVIAQELYFSGNGVYLDHGRGVYTGYFHLSRIAVEPGEVVEAGQLVGEVGSTGRVTGPHLHWSLWVAGTSLDAGSLLEMNVPIGSDSP